MTNTMESLYQETPFKKLTYYPELEMVEFSWKANSTDMEDKDYIDEMSAYLPFALSRPLRRLLIDLTQFAFVISPELQEWNDKTVFPPALEHGLRKVAIIVSQDFISQLSIEQAMETGNALAFESLFFGSREQAWDWLTNA